MKGFWIILAILGVTAAAWVAVGRLVEPSSAPTAPLSETQNQGRNADQPGASAEASSPSASAGAGQPAGSPTLAMGTAAPQSGPGSNIANSAVPSPATTANPATAAAAADAAVPPPVPAASGPGSPATAAAPAKSVEPPSSDPGEPYALPANAAFPADKIVPAKAVKRGDGSIVIDGRFVVKGQGSKDDPYRVTWEHLISAQDVYKPKLGQKRLPERVTFLSGSYVRISGYVAFPITSNNPRECLVMLNQWDGCCIGVPPTAYDAVEVKLGKPASGDDRMAVHGTLEGKLVVDPYEEGGWLLGLYLMEDGSLKPDL